MIRYPLFSFFFAAAALAQHIEIREAPLLVMPGQVDSNSPAFWLNDELHLLNSTGNGPVVSQGSDQFHLGGAQKVDLLRQLSWPTWIESAWVDDGGVILGWYHQEHHGVCGSVPLAQPQIGAVISYDRGRTFRDLGAILTSGDPINCASQNGFFAGGHGDFSVVLDRAGRYFYFLFSNYGGPLESQGVAIARMAFSDRFNPGRSSWKYYRGAWTEPGVGGRLTPVFPAKVSWQDPGTNAFWGASVHWNTYLETFVMLVNRSCCEPGFPQKAIYASFNADLSDPGGWTKPRKILSDTGWYPQVLGTGPGESDTLAGKTARLYIYGQSRWELVFHRSKTTGKIGVSTPTTD